MRYDAVWLRGEDDTVAARVFYRDEKGETKLGEVKFGVDHWFVEYLDSDLPGLKTVVNRNGKPQVNVTVRGAVLCFNAITADALSDGAMVRLALRSRVSDNGGGGSPD